MKSNYEFRIMNDELREGTQRGLKERNADEKKYYI